MLFGTAVAQSTEGQTTKPVPSALSVRVCLVLWLSATGGLTSSPTSTVSFPCPFSLPYIHTYIHTYFRSSLPLILPAQHDLASFESICLNSTLKIYFPFVYFNRWKNKKSERATYNFAFARIVYFITFGPVHWENSAGTVPLGIDPYEFTLTK